MRISKELRQKVYEKYGGRCAYSGTLLEDDWQVDHLTPQFLYDYGFKSGNKNDIKNLVPCQKIINHYKRSLDLEDFRTWYLGGLHERLKKLPRNPKSEKPIKRKEYLLKVASYFDITEQKPFNGKFYFETINN